jgi:hypothetical protein
VANFGGGAARQVALPTMDVVAVCQDVRDSAKETPRKGHYADTDSGFLWYFPLGKRAQ